ncbi:hypothetical protein CXR04_22575 [Streptomyces sp. CMB-StM0423]|nr:hypothetical protein CXR04_22575 [Streptomyces sp. CMB-StM0423]
MPILSDGTDRPRGRVPPQVRGGVRDRSVAASAARSVAGSAAAGGRPRGVRAVRRPYGLLPAGSDQSRRARDARA